MKYALLISFILLLLTPILLRTKLESRDVHINSHEPTLPSPTPVYNPLATPIPLPIFTTSLIKTGQHPFSYISKNGTVIQYLLYFPKQFNSNKKWPLMVFMQGDGQRGNNPELLKDEYLPKMLERDNDMPLIVLSPMLVSSINSDILNLTDELITHILQALPIDTNQLYMSGISLGGVSTWKYALLHPNLFAAIIPISGGYIDNEKDIPKNICDIKKVAIWSFYGDSDPGQKSFESGIIENELKHCGAVVKTTIYKDTNHQDTWHKAYEDPELWKWILSRRSN